MKPINRISGDLERIFSQRVGHAPAEVRQAFADDEPVCSHTWLINHCLMMFIGKQSAITAALERSELYATPFPRLLGDTERALFTNHAHLSLSGIGIDISTDPKSVAIKLHPYSACVLDSVPLIVDETGEIFYTVDFLIAYKAENDTDVMLFGPDEIDSELARHISLLRTNFDAS